MNNRFNNIQMLKDNIARLRAYREVIEIIKNSGQMKQRYIFGNNEHDGYYESFTMPKITMKEAREMIDKKDIN